MSTILNPLIFLLICLVFPFSIQAETINLTQLLRQSNDKLDAVLLKIDGTITVPEKPSNTDILASKYVINFADGSFLHLTPGLDGNFNFQKKEEPKFNEVVKIIEETADSVFYEGKLAGIKTFFYLANQNIDGKQWWCRIFAESPDRIKKLRSSCTIAAKK